MLSKSQIKYFICIL